MLPSAAPLLPLCIHYPNIYASVCSTPTAPLYPIALVPMLPSLARPVMASISVGTMQDKATRLSCLWLPLPRAFCLCHTVCVRSLAPWCSGPPPPPLRTHYGTLWGVRTWYASRLEARAATKGAGGWSFSRAVLEVRVVRALGADMNRWSRHQGAAKNLGGRRGMGNPKGVGESPGEH